MIEGWGTPKPSAGLSVRGASGGGVSKRRLRWALRCEAGGALRPSRGGVLGPVLLPALEPVPF